MSNKNPFHTICDFKWNYPIFMLDRGEFRSCCRTSSKPVLDTELQEKGINAFLNSDNMIKSRLDLIQGIKNADCQTCWKLEEGGAQSPRSTPKSFWSQLQKEGHIEKEEKYHPGSLIKKIANITDLNHPILQAHKPRSLEISLGNTCDMKCMYCNHHYSTQWAAEKIKYNELTSEQYKQEFPETNDLYLEKFWEWFDQVARFSITRMGIIGGEPLIIPKFYDFIDKIMTSVSEIQSKRQEKLTIWIVTNLNTPETYLEKFLNYLPTITNHFNLEIMVSMESLYEKAEYIRYGLNWNRFEKNLRTLLGSKYNFDFGFIMSQNVLSITSIKPCISFIESLSKEYNRPIEIGQSTVTHPTWQSPMILSESFIPSINDAIQYIKNDTNYTEYAIFLEQMAHGLQNNKIDQTNDRRKFYNWFNTYDQRRKLNLMETFPEYIDFHNLCKTLCSSSK